MEKVVLLCRVSTDSQSYERQVNELVEYCDKVNWKIMKIFANKISGAKKSEDRPEVLEMLAYIKENEISRVVCLSIDRLGRNTLEALKIIQTLTDNGVSLFIKNYNIETLVNGKINPVASLICTILLEIASMERRTIRERMESGYKQYVSRCRTAKIKMGRPAEYRKSEDSYKEQYSKEISLLRKGLSLRNVSILTSTSVNTLRKLKSMFV